MKIIDFNGEKYNFITINNHEKYFIFRSTSGESAIVTDHCPHRGGPMHLGKWDENKKAIICPWHRIACKKQYLIHNGLPAIRVGLNWRVLIDKLEITDVSLQMRYINNTPKENSNAMERCV